MNTSDAGVKCSKSWYSPNKDRDIYYVVCISTFEKLEDRGHQWIVPKCYCFVTYYPYFSVHYNVLNTLLSIKRYKRMMNDSEPFET